MFRDVPNLRNVGVDSSRYGPLKPISVNTVVYFRSLVNQVF